MGSQNKLLLPFRGKALIEHIADNVLQSGAGEVIVVIGYEANKISDLLKDRPLRMVMNENYPQGQTTSIHAGVVAAAADSSGFMICLSDLPLIAPEEYARLIRAFEASFRSTEKRILIPVYEGRRGNPVIFSTAFREDILAHQGLMGCKGIIKQNPDQVLEVEMSNDHVLRDIDTIEDYRALVG